MLGYRGVDAGSGAPSSSARSSRRRSSTGNSGAAAGAGAAGGVEAAGAPPSATQLMNLKQLLGVVARLCALHKRRPGGLLEFSRSTLVSVGHWGCALEHENSSCAFAVGACMDMLSCQVLPLRAGPRHQAADSTAGAAAVPVHHACGAAAAV